MGKRKGTSQGEVVKVLPTGGFQFIVTTSSHGKPEKTDRKLIKSHITRNRPKTGSSRELHSWVNHGYADITDKSNSTTSIPKRVGSDYSLVEFPSFLKPDMLRDLVNCT